MALVIKKIYQGYFWLMDELADPRVNDYLFMSSPLPIIIILTLWYQFIFNWGPKYMENRKPYDLKYIMIMYNFIQVLANGYIVYEAILARKVIEWECAEIDYSNSYWGVRLTQLTHSYFLLKVADLIDTIFFVLRKKNRHISFLHTYHHFGMVFLGWAGTKFLGGGHSYYLGVTNTIVHTILYLYYLLTAYDSKYGKLLWLKKFITQVQLLQFAFLLYAFGKLFFIPNCKYPKIVVFFFVPQNLFMMILFGDFYIRTYILPKKKTAKQQQQTQES